MKTILSLLVLTALTPALQAGEKDVWYNAKGKVVKVTPAEKPSERFVPQWEKRELAREANRAARRDGRVRHSSSPRYYYGYPGYYGYHGYGGYYGGYHYPHYYGSPYYGGYYRSPRISGSYHGKGWSVHFRY